MLAESRAELFPKPRDLEAFARDPTPFIVDQGSENGTFGGAVDLWGCGSYLKNGCKHCWSSKGIHGGCDALHRALIRFADSMPKEDAKSADVLVRVSQQSCEAARHTWLLMTLVVYSPKVQVYVRCSVVGQEDSENGFAPTLPALPYRLRLQTTSSRLCFGNNFATLRHETSEELVERLYVAGERAWQLVRLEHKIVEDSGSLLEVEVTRDGETIDLGALPASKLGDDAFHLWQRVTEPKPPQRPTHGVTTARTHATRAAPSGSCPSVGGHMIEAIADEGVFPEHEFDDDDSVFTGGHVGAGLLLAGDDKEEGDEDDNEDLFIDEGHLGGDPTEAPDPAEADAEVEDAQPAAEVITALEAASYAMKDAEGTGAASSSSDAAPPAAFQVSESSEDGLLTISTLGYVRCTRPAFNAHTSTIGLVVLYSGGVTLCASCHVHPRCAIKVSILRQGVPSLRLAEWLALATVPSPQQPRGEKLALGAAHRKMWRRDGPLG